MQSVRDIYCTFTEGLHDGCTERGTYARHNGKAAARGAQCGAAVAGRGSAGRRGRWGPGRSTGGAAPFGLALVIGCPPSYCLAAALGTLAAGLAFQPMLLGFKLAVAAVAAAAVRRLIDGRPGPGRWRAA